MALSIMATSPSSAPTQWFNDAVHAQLEGRHDDARSLYEKIEQPQFGNADVEYNWGTNAAEAGELGPAILHLRRAQILKNNDDIDTNLRTVRERVLETLPPMARDTSLWADLAESLIHVPLHWILTFLVTVFSCIFCVKTIVQSSSLWLRSLIWASGFAVGLSGGLFWLREYFVVQRPAAVVLRISPAKEGPDERFKTLVTLYPGEELRLIKNEESPDYVAAQISSGRVYVRKDAVEKVMDWE